MPDINQKILLELVLSPEGRVYLDSSAQAGELLAHEDAEKIRGLFEQGSMHGLLHLGIQEFASQLAPSFLTWQTFVRQFLTQVCKSNPLAETQKLPSIPAPDPDELQRLINQAFFIRGIEYLNPEVLTEIWQNLGVYLNEELTGVPGIRSVSSEIPHENVSGSLPKPPEKNVSFVETPPKAASSEFLTPQELTHFYGSLQDYLKHYNPRWNLVGRVCFHLAENKNNEARPFAFLATYTTQLSRQASAQHLPLKRALQDYAGEKNQAVLLALLLPIQKASSESTFIKSLVDSGAVFQALTWTAQDAHQFLKEIPLMEASGIVVRVPNWWNPQKPPRPKVIVKVGQNQASVLGLNTLLDFKMHLALSNGEKLTKEEWESLRKFEGNLVKIKGQWIEVDHEKLKTVLSYWESLEKAAKDGLSMAEGLRLLAGEGAAILNENGSGELEKTAEWSTVIAGDWLSTVLNQLRNPQESPEKAIEKKLEAHLQGTLRPYQLAGVQWLWLLYQLKLGGCLADDMGLGKTIQILSLLLMIKHEAPSTKKVHLLVVPASLIGNWQAEILRFAPSLKILIAHSSASNREIIASCPELSEIDVVITTYAFIPRLEWLKKREWDLLILDEAQLIKNPDTKQTRAVKELKAQVRLTLTGTPIENRLGDLWSLFDFTSPGLLGSSKAFSSYIKNSNTHFVSALRKLTQPYILRRLKSDKKIITDLPDKTEMQTFCSLSKEQIQLYQQSIEELTHKLKTANGIQRRGIVLSYLLRFKQICNHPAQWLGYGEFSEQFSGKFIRIREICEEISAKQEKVLIFTQFREIIPALASFLSQVFGREGLVLHGETPIKKRAELVENFQQEQGPPFFILSLKAGGTGLNLTRASHVIHFDRWWNPAVENQATDRAYRIGQKHPVLVHKFICRGTIEEKIDALITSKKNLSQEILEGGNEVLLTELTNQELIDMISLDIHRALGES